MNIHSRTILGIASGARQIGLSVFKDRELFFYAVKTIKGQTEAETLAKMRATVKDLLLTYNVSQVALVKIVFVQQHRSFVKVVFDDLRSLLNESKLPWMEINPTGVRKAICENEKPTKSNTAAVIARTYRELEHYSNPSKIWQKRYHALLLDAMAVGFVCSRDLLE